MSNVDTINRLAKDIAERFGSDINAASEKATSEFNQLYTNILVEVDRTFGNNRDYYEFCEVISDTFTKVMEKYDPQYDFWNFYVSSLKKKALSRIDKRNREKYEKTKSDDGEKSIQDVRKREYSLDEAISGDTESLTVNDSVEDTKDQTDRALYDAAYNVVYLALVDYCLGQKASYSKKKTFNYTPLFFTDQVAFEIITEGDDKIMDLIRSNNIKFNEASDIDFLNTFVDKHCDELSDADGADYLPLSLFTGKEKDSDKPCRAKGKLPYAVIEKYLGSAFGKRVSDSAVKQKKDEYDAVRKSLGERWVL